MDWGRVAKRIRVPLGFLFAAFFLLRAQPRWWSLVAGSAIALAGVGIRAVASGHVKKNEELAMTGPYAYTRNPLYLGSMGIAFGVAGAAGGFGPARWWLGALLVVLFLAIYVPTILSEEAFLRTAFAEFDEYARRVPRLLPRLTPARFGASKVGGGRFSLERYRHHREYNASMGAAAIYVALALRIAFAAHLRF